MYPVAIVGDTATARGALAACVKAGFDDLSWYRGDAPARALPACTISANTTRVISALHGHAVLEEFAHTPDRQQVRMARSGFLLSELPLGGFTRERYGAPLINVDTGDWPALLGSDKFTLQPHQDMSALEQRYQAILVCTPQTQLTDTQATATHALWHAQLPFDAATSRANITWIGTGQHAWQFSTRRHQHVYFSVPVDHRLDAAHWQPMLHPAIEAASRQFEFNAFDDAVRPHWHAGALVYLGEACSTFNPYLREAVGLGLEDAWVLSRMMENYEEDVSEGFSEYEKYRRARTRRVMRAAATAARQMNQSNRLSRLLHHLNVALSTRFLPEIAMHRVDWLYGYDCIKGFR